MSSGSQLALDFASKARQDAHFQEALDRLNQQQRDAVDRIDGPVLVVAGPGTGKTQILALRIGNILQKTDTTPANILCLTYTEAGVFAMRQRLLEYIGPTAYQGWNYSIRGKATDKRNLRVVISFDESGLLIITVVVL